MIGGALARPCISYPNLFHRGTIWDRYPYLLPNLFSAATVFFGVIVGFLFLEETHALEKKKRDRGLELGRRVSAMFRKVTSCQSSRRIRKEKQSLLAAEPAAGYETLSSQLRQRTSLSAIDEPLPAYQSRDNSPGPKPQPFSKSNSRVVIFNRPVIMNVISYGILAL